VALKQVFSEYFSFPWHSLHGVLHMYRHPSTAVCPIGQIVANVPSGHSLIQSQETKKIFSLNFIFVGFILLRYLHMLYKHTTQKPYICDPQTQLTTSLLFRNLTTCFGPYRPSSCDIFLKILTLLPHIHHFYKYEVIYCFLIYM
jgi:hypothetical protein